MVVIYSYLERNDGIVFKFHMDNSTFFDISASVF